MLIDRLNEFADAVAVTGSASTTINVGSQIDLQQINDVGQGQPVYLVITTDTSIITGGSAGTVTFKLVSDDTASISTSTASVHWTSAAFVTDGDDANAAQLDAGGTIACVALPIQGVPYERYLGIQATIATTDITAGKINAFLTLDPRGYTNYPDATN